MKRVAASLRKQFFIVLLIASMACNLGAPALQPASTPAPSPSPTQPLPPAVVETSPPPGSFLPLSAPVTFYFNQPMDRDTVESALTSEPQVNLGFAWTDESTLVVTPGQPFPPNTDISFNLAASVRAANGLQALAPASLGFRTNDFLRLTHFLPEAGAVEITPATAIVAAFNQPVVPLGADPADLPAAFTLEPESPGRAEWINTSTFIFYPEPPLNGGAQYTARLNPELASAAGSPLSDDASGFSWEFSTSPPRLLTVGHDGNTLLPLDSGLVLTFNQPMDTASVEASFSFIGPDSQPVGGSFQWDETRSILTFQPRSLLQRGRQYVLFLGGQARSRGGTPLERDLQLDLDTFPQLSVLSTLPGPGQVKQEYSSVEIRFSAPVATDTYRERVTITPELDGIDIYLDEDGSKMMVYGNYTPSTTYTLNISSSLQDAWGGALGSSYNLTFRTPAASPQLTLPHYGAGAYFVTPDEPLLNGQVTNIAQLNLATGAITVTDFIRLIGPDGFQFQSSFSPVVLSRWNQTVNRTPDQGQAVQIGLTRDGTPLPPGIYYASIQSPQLQRTERNPRLPSYIISSNANLTLKVGARDALVWALDLRSDTPLANRPVSLYDERGLLVASGRTDSDGLWHAEIPVQPDPYRTYIAVLSQPGADDFALALTSWNQGVAPWDFHIPSGLDIPRTKVYLYTERPIYRPGQTVYFRGVVRQAFNGRYEQPTQDRITLIMSDELGGEEISRTLPLSAFGTFHGEITLSENAVPGYYSIRNPDYELYFSYQVADYRKPQIDLGVEFPKQDYLRGEDIRAEVSARYFFDAPAGDLPVEWTLYSGQANFSHPGYSVGVIDTSWFNPYGFFGFSPFGNFIAEGKGRTDANGKFTLTLPEITQTGLQNIVLEVTIRDESGQLVSARANALLHPSDAYIGLRPDFWSGRAGAEIGFDVFSMDWDQEPVAGRSLRAEFREVTWTRTDAPVGSFMPPTFTPQYSLVGSTDFTTAADGRARLAFTPPDPGTYLLEAVSGAATSQVLVWISGPAGAVWPNLPNQHLRLTADRSSYKPGDSAQVFIPNPFNQPSQALVTVERGAIMRSEVIQVTGSGTTYGLPLSGEDAPNVFLSVTLIGPGVEFRQGYLNLPVDAAALTLNVDLDVQPERSAPGGEIVFDLRVTDTAGRPVQGEFSLAVIDKAVLALASPNSPEIVEAFYGEQYLAVQTGMALAAYGQRLSFAPGGGGGGGGDGATVVVRSDFPDTAYWRAALTTDADGRAQVTLRLPDSLTTWMVDLRGVTADSLVGQASAELITSKPLLVRPVTPRFLVAGDHVEMAAVVHNNTDQDLRTDVSLQALNFLLDDAARLTQTVVVPAGGRNRVSWWGTVQPGDQASLLFSARSGEFQDATLPEAGSLPILQYAAPQTFVTAGMLPSAESRLELVSLPKTFTSSAGQLQVEMSPSLASNLVATATAIRQPPLGGGIERSVSYFLPGVELLVALQRSGLEPVSLRDKLSESLASELPKLVARQNEDGGWGWYRGGVSDPFISAYVLFGLVQVRDAGIRVNESTLERGRDYLLGIRPNLSGDALEPHLLDRLAFQTYVLYRLGLVDEAANSALYDWRDHLNPWAQALLALSLEGASPGDERVRTVLSNLQAAAIRTSSGVHWDSETQFLRNPGSPLFTTAVVTFALAKRDPAAPMLVDAVRYLSSQRGRNALWASSFETTWVMLALTEYMKASGELNADFDFSALLNGTQIAAGKASGTSLTTPVTASIPLGDLNASGPNALAINRLQGPGRLYYRAALQVYRPVESVPPLDLGINISRSYLQVNCKQNCKPVQSIRMDNTSLDAAFVTAQLSIIIPNDVYYLVVEDTIPAGFEILNTRLETTQQGEGAQIEAGSFDPQQPFRDGWGWWYFNSPEIYDDHITWTANFLPAGTYMLTYTLVPTQVGEFRVIPARAWLDFFPEVQGTSAGSIFEIRP